MTTACEGGMVTTNDGELADKLRILRSHGMTDRDTHTYLGYNDRMDEVAAAIGIEQLKSLDFFNELRTDNSLYLKDKLADVPWLKFPRVPRHVKHVYFWCNVRVDEEELGYSTKQLRENLYRNGVETRHRYWEPLYKQPVLENYKHLHDYSKDHCYHAEKMVGKWIGLPNHPKLSADELDYVIEKIKK